MSEQDEIGSRGENIVELFLTDPYRLAGGRAMSYFTPVFLGEKTSTLDLLVRLEGVGRQLLFFVAQVKSARDIPARAGSRLPISVAAGDVARLLESPIPTYLIGVDEPNRLAYLLSVSRRHRKGIRSFPRTHELNATNLRLLWEEVRTYWSEVGRPRRRSRFVE